MISAKTTQGSGCVPGARRSFAYIVRFLAVLLYLSVPSAPIVADNSAERRDVPSTPTRTLSFSCLEWEVKRAELSPVGPGLNYFVDDEETVWVDDEGRLHLSIVERDGRWYCSEIYSKDSFGFGEYVFYLGSENIGHLDPNIVLGLFTWDDSSFVSDGNSEIDIEFSHWGYDDGRILMYSVQPVQEREFEERFKWIGLYLFGSYTTHMFSWRPDLVSFRSYHDHGNPTEWQIDHGFFDFPYSDVCRSRLWGDRESECIYVPQPGRSTQVHMNLWLIDGPDDADAIGDPPTDGAEVEVVITRFEHIPAPTLEVLAKAGADLRVTDPNEDVIDKETQTIPGAVYTGPDGDQEGTESTISIPFPLVGEYSIELAPWEDAALSESYSILVVQDGDTCVCAVDERIDRIPLRGYRYDATVHSCERVPGEFLYPQVVSCSVGGPNPFTNSTSIEYELPAESQVSIRLYNATGRWIATLVEDEIRAGRYSVRWDGTDHRGETVATGMYFCRFAASGYAKALKVLFVH